MTARVLEFRRPTPAPAFDPGKRGFAPIYTPGCKCPGCHRSQWWVGAQSAECAWCGVAVALEGGRR